MRITRISKASWFKLKIDNLVVYFDPGYTGYFKNQGIPIGELNNKADYIFVSHFHKDHLQPEAIDLIIKSDTKIYAPESCLKCINYKITVVKPSDVINEGKIQIETMDAYNTQEGHSTRKVHHAGDFVGYIITIDGKKIYHAGDTDVIPEMSTLSDIDIAFLPIGGMFVMDIDEAVIATKIIHPEYVIPMHEVKLNLKSFKDKLIDNEDTKVVCLNVGDSIEL